MIDDLFINQVHCSSWVDFLPMFPEKSVQLVLTSPPYENMINYRNLKKEKVVDNLTGEGFINFFWVKLFENLHRVVRDDGVVVIIIDDKMIDGILSPTNFFGICKVLQSGWHLCERVAWVKTKGIGRAAQKRLQNWWEPAWCFCKTSDYKAYPERIRGEYSETSFKRYGLPGATKKTVIRNIGEMSSRLSSKGRDIENRDSKDELELDEKGKLHPNVLTLPGDNRRGLKHPARFPIDLARFFITLYTDKQDMVLDPMSGSGTTVCAARLLGRKFAGCDIVQDYVDMAIHELDKYREQLDMFDNFYVEPFVCEVPQDPRQESLFDETQSDV